VKELGAVLLDGFHVHGEECLAELVVGGVDRCRAFFWLFGKKKK